MSLTYQFDFGFVTNAEVAGGTDFVSKVIEAFSVPTVQSRVLLDMHGYDGCAALATVEARQLVFQRS